jgi:hypothetical protein
VVDAVSTHNGRLTPVEQMHDNPFTAMVEQWRIDADKAEISIGTDYAKGRAAGLRRAMTDVARVMDSVRAIVRK